MLVAAAMIGADVVIQGKGKKVERNDDIDHKDAEKLSTASVESVTGTDNLYAQSPVFTHSEDYEKFSRFSLRQGDQWKTHIEVRKNIDKLAPSFAKQRPTDEDHRLQFADLVIANTHDAGTFPIQAEGNMVKKKDTGANGGGDETLDHWSAKLDVASLDADVDSDNTKRFDAPERTPDEDKIEDDEGKIGKLIPVNSSDFDGDDIPGYADGFDYDGIDNNKDDELGKTSFAQLVLALPTDTDVKKAKLKITYTASPPSKVERTGEGTPESPYVYKPAPGQLRLWLKPAATERNSASANQTDGGDFVAPGTYTDVSRLGITKSETTIPIYLEGIAPSESLGSDRILFELDPKGDGKWQSDAVRITAFEAKIVAAADYMVPRSERNVIRYKWLPKELTPDAAAVRVFDKSNQRKRELSGLPTTISAADDYIETMWNACEDKDGKKPLTEAGSDYRLDLGITAKSMMSVVSLDYRKIKEWHLTVTVPDDEAYSGATVSGVDPSTVTRAGKKFIVTRCFKDEDDNEEEIANYGLTEDKGDVNVLLKRGTGAKDYYLFYTTPTEPSDIEIKYLLKLDVGKGGCLDRAGNPWDMYYNTDNAWENHGEWTYGIDTAGKMTDFEEDYEEK